MGEFEMLAGVGWPSEWADYLGIESDAGVAWPVGRDGETVCLAVSPEAQAVVAKGLNQLEGCKQIVSEWLGKQGHDKCHFYPELFKQLAEVLGLKAPEAELPPRAEFEAGCKRYQDELYGPKPVRIKKPDVKRIDPAEVAAALGATPVPRTIPCLGHSFSLGLVACRRVCTGCGLILNVCKDAEEVLEALTRLGKGACPRTWDGSQRGGTQSDS